MPAILLTPAPVRPVRTCPNVTLGAAAFVRACTAAMGLALAALTVAAEPAPSPQMDLPRVELTAGLHRISAQVAATDTQRQTGLMHRKQMPAQEGMLFVFNEPGIQCFWMKNTLLPLTAAFVADDGTIVNLADMQPLSEKSHCSAKPVRFVLEMNQGWFSQRRIQPGMRLSGKPFGR